MTQPQPSSLKSILRRTGFGKGEQATEGTDASKKKKSVTFNNIIYKLECWRHSVPEGHIEISQLCSQPVREGNSPWWLRYKAKHAAKRRASLAEKIESGEIYSCVATRVIQNATSSHASATTNCHNSREQLRKSALQHIDNTIDDKLRSLPPGFVASRSFLTGIEDLRASIRSKIKKHFCNAIKARPVVSQDGLPSFSVQDAERDGNWSEVLASREARLRSCASMCEILNTDAEFEVFERRLERFIRQQTHDITRRPASR